MPPKPENKIVTEILKFLFMKFCTYLLPLYEQPFLTELIQELVLLFGSKDLSGILSLMDTAHASKRKSIEDAHNLEVKNLIEDVNRTYTEDSTAVTMVCFNILGYHVGFLKPELNKRLIDNPSQVSAIHAHLLQGYTKRRGPKPISSNPLVRNALIRDKIIFSEVGGPIKEVSLKQFEEWYRSEFITDVKEEKGKKGKKAKKGDKNEEDDTPSGGLFGSTHEERDDNEVDKEDGGGLFNIGALTQDAQVDEEESDDEEVENPKKTTGKKRGSTSGTPDPKRKKGGK